MSQVGRNDLCPCGSGKKYKKCCLAANQILDFTDRKLRKIANDLVVPIMDFALSNMGKEALQEAWGEFVLWDDKPFDPENDLVIPGMFFPWFLYNWRTGVDALKDWDPLSWEDSDENGRQIGLFYLEAFADDLGKLEREFIVQNCQQEFSYFLVLDAAAGQKIELKDIFIDREVAVYDKSASEVVSKGDIIFARVVTVGTTSILLGLAPMSIPNAYYASIIEMKEDFLEDVAQEEDVLFEFDDELREFYFELRESFLQQKLSFGTNEDGEPVEVVSLFYSLACSPRVAFSALKTLSAVIGEKEMLESAIYSDEGELSFVQIHWAEKASQEDASMGTLLGWLTIDEDELLVEVSSEDQASAMKQIISKRLGGKAEFLHEVTQTHEEDGFDEGELFADDLFADDELLEDMGSLLDLPGTLDVLDVLADEYWEEWLNKSLPALKGKTPRQAAKNAQGRAQLETLMTHFGCTTENAPHPFSPDVLALKITLGLVESDVPF